MTEKENFSNHLTLYITKSGRRSFRLFCVAKIKAIPLTTNNDELTTINEKYIRANAPKNLGGGIEYYKDIRATLH